MYESFFELEARPFMAAPMSGRYYPSASIENARKSATRCLERGEGPAVILGAAGTGKSVLCHVLAEQMRDSFRVAMLASARLCTRRALLQNILFELKQPYRDREEGELRLSLIDFLNPSEACPHGMLLVVDEAHMLPLRLLEELRMLTNLVRDGQPRVRLILAANLALDERLACPKLESFNQRIAARCYLQSMNRDETYNYARAQINVVGGTPDRVFTEDALQAIYRATDGIPRLVNQLCDHALVMAAASGNAPVDNAGVEEAWADLQQLPSPWISSEPTGDAGEESSGILEFGELDDPESELDDPECIDRELDEESETAAEQVESQVTTCLDEIESALSNVSEDRNATAQPEDREHDEPQGGEAHGQRPEIELAFHAAHDPFGEPFDDEEVVVDSFTTTQPLDDSSQPDSTATDDGNATIPFRGSDGPTGQEPEDLAHESLTAVQPDQIRESIAETMSDAADSVNSLPGDDRDLLEIHDDLNAKSAASVTSRETGPPQRRAYRQLFAYLRRS